MNLIVSLTRKFEISAGERVDVDREPIQTGRIGDQAAAGSAIGQRPPLIAVGLVVDIREETEPAAVRARLIRGVEGVAGNPETVDEDRLRRDGRGLHEREGRESAEK